MKKTLINLNKKGQVGDTTTWVFATLIILFILFVAIFSLKIVGLNSSLKNVGGTYADDIIQKSAFGFLETKNSQGMKFFEVLKNSGEMDEESNFLANKIFIDNKDNYYWKISFGIGSEWKYFFLTDDSVREDNALEKLLLFIQPVYLSKNKLFELRLFFPK